MGVMHHIAQFLAANPYNITANQIKLPTSTGNLGVALANIMKILMALVGMLSIVFIIYGGILFTYAQGVASRVQKARETLLYASVGLVLSIGAFAVVTYITASLSTP